MQMQRSVSERALLFCRPPRQHKICIRPCSSIAVSRHREYTPGSRQGFPLAPQLICSTAFGTPPARLTKNEISPSIDYHTPTVNHRPPSRVLNESSPQLRGETRLQKRLAGSGLEAPGKVPETHGKSQGKRGEMGIARLNTQQKEDFWGAWQRISCSCIKKPRKFHFPPFPPSSPGFPISRIVYL